MPELDTQNLRDQYLTLLDECRPEQDYQSFLEQNTRLIPREFVLNHGVHLELVLRKLSLAADYTTDFFYLTKSSINWHCVLIEIEKPQSRFFKNNSNNFHADFNAGLQQVSRWRAWFQNRANTDGFLHGTLGPIRRPMAENPCSFKYVLVHGRRSEYEQSPQRRALIQAQQRDDFRIMSFDALAEAVSSKEALYLGVRKNEHIEIRSQQFLGEGLFSWVDPHALKITQELRSSILAGRETWRTYRTVGELLLDSVLPQIGSCAA